MEQGPVEKKIIEECQRTGRPLPPKIAEAPQLILGLHLYLEAFLDLMGDRSGMGDGRIPWSARQKYAEAHGFEGELLETFHHHVRALDDAWLQYQSSERERKKKEKPDKSGTTPVMRPPRPRPSKLPKRKA